MLREVLVGAVAARTLDGEAVSQWSFNNAALVEAAGRGAARVLLENYASLFEETSGDSPLVLALAGTGSNGADAMVILRSLILWGRIPAANTVLLVTKIPHGEDQSPGAEVYRSLVKMGVRLFSLSGGENPAILGKARLIIDGLCGTGLKGPLRDTGLAGLLNDRESRSVLVSVDVPSGLFDDWKPGMPLLRADATLAIEPEKLCLYKPAARPFCGRILHVGGIFPPALAEKHRGAELVGWDYCRTLIPPVPPDSYKYSRGLVEIRAGAPGSTGAAKIAARGAQAAGAGMVRLLVDPAIHSILASSASAVMVDVAGGSRFEPDALLLGPGWGRGPERRASLEEALALEEAGTPLVLDADAIHLAEGRVFHGNALLTPHPGELAAYSGIPAEELLADPGPLLLSLAREKKALILFKSHVMFIASPGGELAVVDGMRPVLGAGGSGDLLAGLCAGIAGRCRSIASRLRSAAGSGSFRLRGGDLYACAMAGASLLIQAAADPRAANRFADPMELAGIAAELAGLAWLPGFSAGFSGAGKRER
ncbi:MAG: bifunctional ADP-dependent NAD(P)H-hydrate dehydratase/NAD(P)H-hydrate epimerase [Treponema sp.]|jgi:NAD(P)H-hydrate epimerase|nr:bifunctional ADP-dependent NAD(P)H-hydrate dehydratase/NAD(P)H-hydrate epimerase [Treponema sp.]